MGARRWLTPGRASVVLSALLTVLGPGPSAAGDIWQQQALLLLHLPLAVYPPTTLLFTAIGLEIKAKSPLKPVFTIELANGYNGYLPTPEEHKLGGYETWRARSSYLEENASVEIVRTLLGLLTRTSQ